VQGASGEGYIVDVNLTDNRLRQHKSLLQLPHRVQERYTSSLCHPASSTLLTYYFITTTFHQRNVDCRLCHPLKKEVCVYDNDDYFKCLVYEDYLPIHT